MRKWLDPLITAWIGVVSHKLRSFLTILGIVIGVGAVIALMSIGKGVEQYIVSGIQGLGSNLVFIQPGAMTSGGVRAQSGTIFTLTMEDAEAISTEITYVTAVAPVFGTFQQVVAGNENMFTRITGMTPAYQQALNLKLAKGDFITEEHYRGRAKVVIIGPNVVDMLFKNSEPLDQNIRIGSINARVIGVLQSRGATVIGSTDDAILMPMTTMQQTVSQQRAFMGMGRNVVSSVIVQVRSQQETRRAIDAMTSLLRYRHRLTTPDNDFTITSQDDMAKTLSDTMAGMTFLLGAIAAISLLVGGIGVMNIMLVSVMERTREIGIRKALGAQELEIIIQFLIEAAALTLTGGIIGIMLGWGASYMVGQMGTYTTLVSPDIVILAFSISVGIGIFFGFYPAVLASRLKPIEALRYE